MGSGNWHVTAWQVYAPHSKTPLVVGGRKYNQYAGPIVPSDHYPVVADLT
jgi:hypothetical protein